MESLMTMSGMGLPASLRTHELEAKAINVRIATTGYHQTRLHPQQWAVVDGNDNRVLFAHSQPHVVGAYIQGLYDQEKKRK